MHLRDAYIGFESTAMSAYQTGTGEGQGLVCWRACDLTQLSKWQVNYVQWKNGVIARYKVSFKQPYSSFVKKDQVMVMSGSHVAAKIKSLLIHACERRRQRATF